MSRKGEELTRTLEKLASYVEEKAKLVQEHRPDDEFLKRDVSFLMEVLVCLDNLNKRVNLCEQEAGISDAFIDSNDIPTRIGGPLNGGLK